MIWCIELGVLGLQRRFCSLDVRESMSNEDSSRAVFLFIYIGISPSDLGTARYSLHVSVNVACCIFVLFSTISCPLFAMCFTFYWRMVFAARFFLSTASVIHHLWRWRSWRLYSIIISRYNSWCRGWVWDWDWDRQWRDLTFAWDFFPCRDGNR
jgi:hypothetical protein